jgi:hypothetical protein
VVAVAGGGYAAVKQLPSDRSPATPSRTTSAAPNQTQKPADSTPVGGDGTSTDNCLRQPPATLGACSDTARTKADRGAKSNRQDECVPKAANALNGCSKGASDRLPTDRLPTGRLPTGRLPTGRLPAGVVPPTDRLPTDRLPKGSVPPTDRLPKGPVPPTDQLPSDRLPKGSVPPTDRLPKGLVPPPDRP